MRYLFFFLSLPCWAASVTTASYSNSRPSANTNEIILRPQVVQNHFGKLGTWTVDGPVYAQPLIVDGVSIGSATAVMVTATMHGTIYAFDANRPGTTPLWSKPTGPGFTNYPCQTGCTPLNKAFYGLEVGCVATPVIDPDTAIVYEVCPDTAGEWWLYGQNLADGTDAFARVHVAGSDNGNTFVGQNHVLRAALTLMNGSVYFNAASYGDIDPFQGWIFRHNAATGAFQNVRCITSTANGEGGLWWSGGGMTVSGSKLYFSTGNGTYDGGANLGSSYLRLADDLTIEDSGTPADFANINLHDLDLNSGKTTIAQGWLIGAGKDGRVFVFDPANLGQLEGSGPGPHQLFAAQNGPVFGCTTFANNSLILGALNTTLKRFSFDPGTGLFNTSPVTVGDGPYASPGPNCTLSVNSSNTSTAVLWGVTPAASAFSAVRAGTLRAWDGNTLQEIWNSDLVPADLFGNYAKFAMQTVVNGKVYAPTFSNQIALYGVLPSPWTVKYSGELRLSGATYTK